MVSRSARSALALLALLVPATVRSAPAPDATGELVLHAAAATPRFSDPALLRVTITFSNQGETPLLVLPALLRRHYRPAGEATAEYVPYPGPPLSPWRGAFALQAGASHSTELSGMRDGDGIWRLGAGSHELTVTYAADPALREQQAAAPLPAALREVPLWVGELESPPVHVVYTPGGEG